MTLTLSRCSIRSNRSKPGKQPVVAGGRRTAALHIDTGMARLGIPLHDVAHASALLAKASSIELAMLISHLACANETQHPMNRIQLERFTQALRSFPDTLASLSASAGILLGDDYLLDVVRPGIGLYGGNPRPAHSNPLSPTVRVTAPVIQIRRIGRGDPVGYGSKYVADAPRRLATVPVGYADGFGRALTDGASAFLLGEFVPIVGRVSMDALILDVTDLDPTDLVIGSQVELIGQHITVDDVARSAGTISNEILTSLGGRLDRVYEHWVRDG